MQVTIKSFDLDIDIKNKGIELDVYSADGSDHLGDLVITKSQVIWCDGRKSRENGIKVSWTEFIKLMKESG